MMSMKLFLLLCTLAWPASCSLTCRDVMHQHGMNMSHFVNAAAHGIHSLYLEDIRYFFEPSAPLKNGIPVVNFNLAAAEPILFNSPLAGYDTDLASISFQTMDFVFSHDGPDFSFNADTVIEKLGHAFHMHEVWMRAKVFYDEMKLNPPAEQLCHCSNDIWSNGILEELAFVAETVRLFGTEELRRFSGCEEAIPNQQYYDYYQYKRDCVGKTAKHIEESDIKKPFWTAGTVSDAKGWPLLKTMLQTSLPSQDEIQMLATFLHCRLNKA